MGRAAMRFGALTFLSQSARRREVARSAGSDRMLVRPPDYWSGNHEAEEAETAAPIKTGDAAYDALIARRTRVLRAARPPRSMPRGLPSTVHRRGVSMAGPQTGPGSVVRRLTPAPVKVAPNPASTTAKVTTTLSPAPTTPRGARGRSPQRTSTRGGNDRPGHPAPARPSSSGAPAPAPAGATPASGRGAAERTAAISTPSFDAILGRSAPTDVQRVGIADRSRETQPVAARGRRDAEADETARSDASAPAADAASAVHAPGPEHWYDPIEVVPPTSAALVGARRAAGVLPSAARSVHSASAHHAATHASSTDHATAARRFAPSNALAGRSPWSDVRRLPVAGPSFIATRVGVAGTEQAPSGGELRRNPNGTGVRWVAPQAQRSASSAPSAPARAPARPHLTPQRAFAVVGSPAVDGPPAVAGSRSPAISGPLVRRTPASLDRAASATTEWGRVEPAALARLVQPSLRRAATDPIGRAPARHAAPSIQPVAGVSASAWGRVGPGAVGDVVRRSLLGRATQGSSTSTSVGSSTTAATTRGATFAERAAEVFGRTPPSLPVAPPRGVPASPSERSSADAPGRRDRASRTPRGSTAPIASPTPGRPGPRADGRRPEPIAPTTPGRATPGAVRRTPTTAAHWADPIPAPEHRSTPSAPSPTEVGRPAWPGGLFATAAGVRADAVMRLALVRGHSGQSRASAHNETGTSSVEGSSTSPRAAMRTVARPGTVLSTSTTHAPLRRSADATAAAKAEHAGAAPMSWSQRVAAAAGIFDVRRLPVGTPPLVTGTDRSTSTAPVSSSTRTTRPLAAVPATARPTGPTTGRTADIARRAAQPERAATTTGSISSSASVAGTSVASGPTDAGTSSDHWVTRVASAGGGFDIRRVPISRLPRVIGDRPVARSLQQSQPATTAATTPNRTETWAQRVAAVAAASAAGFDVRRMPVGGPMVVSVGGRAAEASAADAAVRRTPDRSMASTSRSTARTLTGTTPTNTRAATSVGERATSPSSSSSPASTSSPAPATWAARVAAASARGAADVHRLPVGRGRLHTAATTGSTPQVGGASGAENGASSSLAARVAAVWGDTPQTFDVRRMPVGAPPLVPSSGSTAAAIRSVGGPAATTDVRRVHEHSDRVTAQRLPGVTQPTSARAVAARSIAPLAIGRAPEQRHHTTASDAVRAAQLLPNSAPRQRDLGAQLVRRAMALPMAPPALVAGSSNVLPGIRSTPSGPGIRRATSGSQPQPTSTSAPLSTAARLNELVASGAFEGTTPVRRTPAPTLATAPAAAATTPRTVATAASPPATDAPRVRVMRTAAERFETVLRSATTVDKPVALPARFRPLAERIVGPRIAVQVVHGAVTRRALEAAGHDAATTDRTIHLPSRPDSSAHTMSIVAHELEHVAAPSPAPRFHGGPSSPEETRATRTEQVVRRLASRVEARTDTSMGTAGLPVGGLTAFGRSGAGAPAAPASATSGSSSSSTATSSSSSSRPSSGSSDNTIHRTFEDDSPPARRPQQPTRGGRGQIRRLASAEETSTDQGESGQSDSNPALSPAQLSAIIRAVEDRLLEEIERRGGLWRGSF